VTDPEAGSNRGGFVDGGGRKGKGNTPGKAPGWGLKKPAKERERRGKGKREKGLGVFLVTGTSIGGGLVIQGVYRAKQDSRGHSESMAWKLKVKNLCRMIRGRLRIQTRCWKKAGKGSHERLGTGTEIKKFILKQRRRGRLSGKRRNVGRKKKKYPGEYLGVGGVSDQGGGEQVFITSRMGSEGRRVRKKMSAVGGSRRAVSRGVGGSKG